MKKTICVVMLFVLAGTGCAMTKKKVRSYETLKYRTIVIMPFTEGSAADNELVSGVFYKELQQFEEIQVIGREMMNQQFIEELELNHPLSTGVVDFTMSEEGNTRREKVRDLFGADAIIFGSLFMDGEVLSFAVQMLDVESGELTLSFTRESGPSYESAQAAWTGLARSAVEKIISHIQDNRIVTSIYKYE